ncbi:MAG: DUF3090 family protein [Acidimicrobiales bacterium]|nr:DUF3090 family protein [Acidimicrobiales bacterium]
MSESFNMLEVSNLVTGTVGEPGQRIFFLQARDTHNLVSLKLEKGQAHALASGILEILDDRGDTSDPIRPEDLVEPVMAAWTVASLGIGIEEDADRVHVIVEELTDDEDDEPATARFGLTFAQARGFAGHALLLIEHGRDFGRQNGHRPH